MTFALLQDLQDRFGADELLLLADRDRDGAVDPGVVDAALADADAEIVSYIGRAAPIDTSSVPKNLVRIACDIARYRLYGAQRPDDVRQRYADAVAFLKAVAAGQATLDGGPSSPTAAAPPPLAAAVVPGDRVFKRGL